MAEFPAFPLWTDAYLGDTTHLTTMEHGAYLLLMMVMWRNDGWLPNDDALLAKYARARMDQWRAIKPTLMAFFTVVDDRITQGRLSDELELARMHSAKQSGRAKGRWAKKQKPCNTAPGVPRSRLDSQAIEIQQNDLCRGNANPSPPPIKKEDHPLTPSQAARSDDDRVVIQWPPKPRILTTEESERLHAEADVRSYSPPRPRRTPEEESARLDQTAVVMADQFLHQHEIYWPDEGELRMVRMPLLTLRAEAREWIEAGVDLELFIDVLDKRMELMAATGKSPPRSIKAFHLSLHDALAARMAG